MPEAYEIDELEVDPTLLRDLRKRLRVSQAQLATILFTTSEQVHRMERPPRTRQQETRRRATVVHFRVAITQRLSVAFERHGRERAWPAGALTLFDRIAVILLLSADDPEAVRRAAGLQP